MTVRPRYRGYTPAGRRIAICPATYSDATCKSCGVCARVRDTVIGFPAHGAWRRVEAATAAPDVPVGHSWAFREHLTMAEIIAAETQQPDAFTLQISRSGGSRCQKLSPGQMTTTPRSAACPAGFLRFGPEPSSGGGLNRAELFEVSVMRPKAALCRPGRNGLAWAGCRIVERFAPSA